MEILTKTELEIKFEKISQKIKEGTIFIHPTDTIYGISCNATNKDAVKKIRDLKKRPETPFSVWAPSTKWIRENCLINKEAEEWLDKLPGPYTLVLKLKNKKIIADNVSFSDSLGVRIPEHWFSNVVEILGFPIITTSVNKAGEQFMTGLDNLDQEMQGKIDFIVYEGEKKVRPSKIINLVEKKIKER